MTGARKKIDAAVSRELRRRSGFGCCRCGLPIYQYHHIVPWSSEQHYRVEDMMVLCPTCHDAATKGALDEAAQRKLQAEPFNIRQGYASGTLHVNQRFCAVRCGGTLLVGDGPAVLIDGEELLRLDVGEGGELQLTVDLRDEEGDSLAVIERNEWVSGDPTLWDMHADHQKLKLWQAQRQIALAINATGQPMQVRADLWHSGHRVRLNARGIAWDFREVAGGSIRDLGLVGFSLEVNSHGGSLAMVPYRGEGFLVSDSDPLQRLTKSLNAWQRLTGSGGALLT